MGTKGGLCWICKANKATSGEHAIKKSDIKLAFPEKQRLYFHTAEKKNIYIQGSNSVWLKPLKICPDCNNKRLQPYDKAWDAFSKNCLDQRTTETPASLWRKLPTKAQQQIRLFLLIKLGCITKRLQHDKLRGHTSNVKNILDQMSNGILTEKLPRSFYAEFLPPAPGLQTPNLEVLNKKNTNICMAVASGYNLPWVSIKVAFAVHTSAGLLNWMQTVHVSDLSS
ncbi:MAG: hypothetical protein GC134_04105 [Proteobacteria bacterium]|nr:hypothetical protein [Pseudomonadota bacterium]